MLLVEYRASQVEWKLLDSHYYVRQCCQFTPQKITFIICYLDLSKLKFILIDDYIN